MLSTWSEDMKRIFLAGVGAVAVTGEKSKVVIDQLVQKGELTVEQGRALNEELKHNVREKMASFKSSLHEPEMADLLAELEDLTEEEWVAIEQRIAALREARQQTAELDGLIARLGDLSPEELQKVRTHLDGMNAGPEAEPQP